MTKVLLSLGHTRKDVISMPMVIVTITNQGIFMGLGAFTADQVFLKMHPNAQT